jgi:hypothetical protein
MACVAVEFLVSPVDFRDYLALESRQALLSKYSIIHRAIPQANALP